MAQIITAGGLAVGVTGERETTRPPAPGRVAVAVGAAWRGLADAFGVFEWITTVGVVTLLVGLWLWFGAGQALAAVGALVAWMGIAGGRAAAGVPASVDDAVEE